MGSSRSDLAFLSRSELGEVSVIVSLPASTLDWKIPHDLLSIHLVVEDLGFSRFGLWNEGIIKDIKDILADFLEFAFNLLAVFTDDGNVFLRALGFFLLLDGGDDAPGSTSRSDDILVGNGKKVSLIDREFSAQLDYISFGTGVHGFWTSTHISNLFHVVHHLIVAFGLLAEPRKESFTRRGQRRGQSEPRRSCQYLSRCVMAFQSASCLIRTAVQETSRTEQAGPETPREAGETYISSHFGGG